MTLEDLTYEMEGDLKALQRKWGSYPMNADITYYNLVQNEIDQLISLIWLTRKNVK